MDEIEKFIRELAECHVEGYITNMYDDKVGDNEIKRENLKLYLKEMKKLNPKYVLIGEAPGYRGCLLTGIPFTSEYIIMNNKFFRNKGYDMRNKNNKISKEGTATITWEAFDFHNQYPLLWNSFPFHPHKAENFNSNRKPYAEELKIGKVFLEKIFELFPTIDKNKVGALGRIAENLLINKMKIKAQYITHPRIKNRFREDLKNFFEDN